MSRCKLISGNFLMSNKIRQQKKIITVWLTFSIFFQFLNVCWPFKKVFESTAIGWLIQNLYWSILKHVNVDIYKFFQKWVQKGILHTRFPRLYSINFLLIFCFRCLFRYLKCWFFFFFKVQRQRAHFTSSINTCYLSRMWSDLVQSLQCSEFTAWRCGYLANREAFHLRDILYRFFFYWIVFFPHNLVKVLSH